MSIPQRPRQPTGHAGLEWVVTDDGSRTLYDPHLQETFHSGCGAVAETLVVYTSHSGVLHRLRAGRSTMVLEYGLGTATGFLLTAALAEYYRAQLVFGALECTLLSAELFRQLELPTSVDHCIAAGLARSTTFDPAFQAVEFQALPKLVDSLCRRVASVASGPTQGQFTWRFSEFVELRLRLGDARTFDAAAQAEMLLADCDAIYFDPFSPEANPELWTAEVFEQAVACLRPGGRLTSYCVKSEIRRRLAAAGMQVDKWAGPVSGKREVLVATNP